MRPFQAAYAGETLRRPFHDLEPGFVDRSERDVIGLCRQRDGKLFLAVGADAEARALAMDQGHVGTGQILLAEMDIVRAQLQRLAPVVVDDQLATGARADLEALGDLAANALGRRVLEAELDGAHAERHQPPEPGDIGHDRIEDVEAVRPRRHQGRSRSKNGVPATGVDGAAMSRTSIRPAS